MSGGVPGTCTRVHVTNEGEGVVGGVQRVQEDCGGLAPQLAHRMDEWNEWRNVRAFEGFELPLFDLLEPMVAEGTDECILCQTISERLGLKGADTAPESWRPPGASRACVPGYKKRTAGIIRRARYRTPSWRNTYYLPSGNLADMVLEDVSAQKRASKLWKQCSGRQSCSTSAPGL